MMAGGPAARCAEALAADCARQQKRFTAPGRRSSAARTTAPRYCWLCSAMSATSRTPTSPAVPASRWAPRARRDAQRGPNGLGRIPLPQRHGATEPATRSRRPACASGVPTGECPQEPPRHRCARRTEAGLLGLVGRSDENRLLKGADMTDAAPGRRSHVIISGITTVIYVHGFSGSRVW